MGEVSGFVEAMGVDGDVTDPNSAIATEGGELKGLGG